LLKSVRGKEEELWKGGDPVVCKGFNPVRGTPIRQKKKEVSQKEKNLNLGKEKGAVREGKDTHGEEERKSSIFQRTAFARKDTCT